MYDYLPTATADYDYTLTVIPHNALSFTAKKKQIIHTKDDGSVKVYSLSGSYSYFDVVVDWSKVTQANHGTIFDLWNDPAKANGSENTFYWSHPVDGHTYVVRFMGDMESEYVAGYGTRIIPIKPITLRVEGRKAD